jgi:hypothetical protein
LPPFWPLLWQAARAWSGRMKGGTLQRLEAIRAELINPKVAEH